jgi:hypothetical protein
MARSPDSLGLPALGTEEVPLYAGDMEADLRLVARDRLAERITGGLSFPSKMPCPSWGIPATRCRIGALLARTPGSTCQGCYALKGRYRFGAVQARLERRYAGLFHELWTPAMVFLVRYYCGRYFRLFDSGDLQGVNHLRNVVTLARHTPDVQTWLPTRETGVVRAVLREIGAFPANLTVRVSAAMIDGRPPRGYPTTSTVVRDPGAATCPAPQQEGRCGECRACWDPAVSNVAYAKH